MTLLNRINVDFRNTYYNSKAYRRQGKSFMAITCSIRNFFLCVFFVVFFGGGGGGVNPTFYPQKMKMKNTICARIFFYILDGGNESATYLQGNCRQNSVLRSHSVTWVSAG